MEALDVENQEPHWPCVGKRPLLCNWMFKKKKKKGKFLLDRHRILAEVQPHTYSKLNLGIALIITVTL